MWYVGNQNITTLPLFSLSYIKIKLEQSLYTNFRLFQAIGRGTSRDPGGCPCPSRMHIEVGDKYGGMANVSAVNSKWDGTGCAGMTR